MTHPGGAPRTVSLPPDEMILLGIAMVKWIEEKDPIHLSEWYCIEKGFTYNEWKTMQVRAEFVPYYEKALKMIGLKYLRKNSDIEPALKQRWSRVYFEDFREREDQDLDKAAERQKGIDGKHYTTINYIGDGNLGGKEQLSPPELSTTISKSA
jgi:hypothetical protein